MKSRHTLDELGNDEKGLHDVLPEHVEHCNVISSHPVLIEEYPTIHGGENLRGCESIRKEHAGDDSQIGIPFNVSFITRVCL